MSLKEFETQAAPVLTRIAKSRSVADLTPEERNRVADFMTAQSFRTKAFYKGMEFGVPRERFGPIFAQLWRSAFLVSNEIERRKWVVMTIEADDVFYLGDNPVVLQRTENPSAGGELGFDIEGVEVFMPVTPKCALYAPCISTSEEIISGYEHGVRLRQQALFAAMAGIKIPEADLGSLQLARRVVRDSSDLYQSLTNGVAISANQKNVENLNYLQCAWAHTAVYSNRGDFAFAKRVFREISAVSKYTEDIAEGYS